MTRTLHRSRLAAVAFALVAAVSRWFRRHPFAAVVLGVVAAVVLLIVVYWRTLVLWGSALVLGRMLWILLVGRPPRRSRGTMLALAESTLALGLAAFGLSRTRGRTGPAWHPCENCGAPIDLPSRAAYCSQGCRADAARRRREREFLDDPELTEIPY